MKFFSQKNGEFFAENVPLSQIAKQFGTPTYVYSKQALTSAFELFSEGFSGTDHLVCFAVKSNPSLAILNTFAKLGAGFDIVSGGELARVIAAGGDPSKVVFSGVGKTELSRTLAQFLFGDADALIQLDMSEYSERHTASRLFGAPPGYVGYDEGGQLTEKVRRRPFSVVLFDEIEKAHPDIFNSLLQVLEDGRLTDSQGRTVDFKNTVIIMTTNLGTRDISKSLGLGFANADDDLSNYERMKGKVSDELKSHFRPEFLNRIDDIIVFHQLTKPQIIQIVDLMLKNLDDRLQAKDMGIELTPAAKDLLAERGYDPLLGARPLRRVIQREIEDGLSERILFGELKAGEIIVVDVEGEGAEAVFTFRGAPKASLPDTPEDLAEAPTA